MHRREADRGQYTVRHGQGRCARFGLAISVFFFFACGAVAAPYAAMVMDARSGEVLHSRNADTRLHPASLTKMMTLYIAFEAVEHGEISLDTKVKISRHAASEPPSKLGLRAGQEIALRYLIRAAAVKSANDAATAIGEALEGSEAAFARRMNRTAKALGMTRTTFKNMHGLTESGHLSTARDMTILGRHMLYDYPEYYNLFSRRSTDAGLRTVSNTNRRLLSAYKGADGIKTGYTRAAGFNLVASAERGSERIIATVFGGRSTATRNKRVAELLDMGFSRAPTRVAMRMPGKPPYLGKSGPGTTRVAAAVARSLRPMPRPVRGQAPAEEVLVALQGGIDRTLVALDLEAGSAPADGVAAAEGTMHGSQPGTVASVAIPDIAPKPRPEDIVLASTGGDPVAAAIAEATGEEREVVTRLSTAGGRHWGITIGRFNTRHQAERVLLQTALIEISTLDTALRKVVRTPRGFDANFVGLSEDQASLVCRRLTARNLSCEPLGPG